MHELAYRWGWPHLCMCYVTTGHVEVEQAPFEPVIARCYLTILSIEHNLSQKFDLETVAIYFVIAI